MKYLIVQIFKPFQGSENFVEDCFKIVGQLYGYQTIEEAIEDRKKTSNPDHCIIIQALW